MDISHREIYACLGKENIKYVAIKESNMYIKRFLKIKSILWLKVLSSKI
jgi:hypothetical protein